MEYEVIKLNSELQSFKYNDGLFIVVGVEGNEIKLCKLDKDGNPQRFDDGRLMLTITGKNNKGIKKTKLIYTD